MLFKKKNNGKNNPENNIEIYSSLERNLKVLQDQFKDCSDITISRIKTASERAACIIFVNGLIDNNLVQRDVLSVLIKLKDNEIKGLEYNNIFPIMQYEKVYIIEQVIDNILLGNTVVLIDGLEYALSFNLQKLDTRNFEEPEVERIIKGQHDGFVESVPKNISLIRRKVLSSKLKVKTMTLGKRSHSKVALLYIEDIADPNIVKEVEKRLNSIEIDSINASGTIEQLTNDNKLSLFPQYQGTERPDKAIGNLMEGRIILIVDSTPVVLILPVNYFQFFQTPDDYNINYFFGSFLRMLRFIGTILAVLLPALYIAILTYHYQAIPISLLVPLAESRSKVPFPPIIEALIMEMFFELLREASIRLPSSLGPTIGIVGGLVIGQTAVQAGIVSNIMVIVVGITAIATFVVPQYDMGLLLRVGRFAAMINAAIFGIIGVVIFVLLALAHMVSLESYGQPYFQPIAPFKLKDLKDIFFRVPLHMQKSRPDVASPKDKTRGRKKNGT